MEKVVYVLGAGFSAPLGLPVISNFIDLSKDLYREKREKTDKYEYFSEINSLFDKLGNISAYYEYDASNIEDVLSILEMNSLSKTNDTDNILRFIKDVIAEYTPDILKLNDYKNSPYLKDWHMKTFGDINQEEFDKNYIKSLINLYAKFISSIFNLEFSLENYDDYRKKKLRLSCTRKIDKYEYNIITLNYDLVIERLCEIINTFYNPDKKIIFNNAENNIDTNPYLLKLHGSIDNIIVPPTWNKMSKNFKELAKVWSAALKLLSEANYIRIIGYSLPETDTYMKYLFKASYLNNPSNFHLKKIDVICKDDSDNVKTKFEKFIKLRSQKFRFKKGDFAEMLKYINYVGTRHDGESNKVSWDLEAAHNEFMNV